MTDLEAMLQAWGRRTAFLGRAINMPPCFEPQGHPSVTRALEPSAVLSEDPGLSGAIIRGSWSPIPGDTEFAVRTRFAS